MSIVSMILTVLGLSLFETVSSADNAIVNAEVLAGMSRRRGDGSWCGGYSSRSSSAVFASQGVWFFAVAAVFLALTVWYSLKVGNLVAIAAVVGSTVFFITHGFKENAEAQERRLLKGGLSDVSKSFYLEIIDTTFSIDGVLGAFAFTLSVPLIVLGNGLGAVLVRQITVGNIDRIRKLAS